MMPRPTRRRFITLLAAATAMPAAAEVPPVRWRGVALGAEAAITIHAPRREAERALREVRRVLREVEALFSLYDPASMLSRLNAQGHMEAPDRAFVDLLRIAGEVCEATGGVFDPTVQPLWQALAMDGDREAAEALVGWDRVRQTPERVTLGPGQSLTLNGIAQGYATDLAAEALRAVGLTKVLVNIGEIGAIGGPFSIGISDSERGLIATRQISDRALATSSPGALHLPGEQSHILHPQQPQGPRWATVTVEADRAAIADAASTAFCLMDRAAIAEALTRLPGRPQAILLRPDGTLETLG